MKKVLSSILMLTILTGSVFAATFQVDASHSDVGFSVRHLGVSKTRGQFSDIKGTIQWDGKKSLDTASFEGVVGVASIDTQNTKRDGHLKSADFFDAEAYPTMTFKSTSVRKRRGDLQITGDLTIHGVTKKVTFPATIHGPVTDPWGNEKLGVEGTFEIDRRDFGLTWNKTLDKGGVLIGDDVTITLSIEANKAK